jgi:membrane protein YdbS with pleckstrin-like domain
MPFPRRLLTEDEEVVVELRPHWAFLGTPLVVAVAVVALAIAVAVNFSNAPVGVLYVLLALVTGSALWLAGRLVRWFASSFVVTNTRIIQRTGVLSRRGLELRLERVNQLSYHQSIPDRILRTGELQVEMGGDTGLLVFDHVPRPAAVQSVITEQIDALRHRAGVPVSNGPGHAAWNGAPPPGSTNERGLGGRGWQEPGITGDTPPAGTARVARSQYGEDSVAERLVQLDELRRRGIVTDAEFASKKAELLDRL